jgi:RNA polymerase sigma-70 factor (ECF subfamily)
MMRSSQRSAERLLRTFEDNDLAEKAAKGDVRAFARLVRNHSGLVYRVASRILSTEDAKDASQEVWIRVWQNIDKFRGESAFSTWLYRVTVNTCLSTCRRKKNQQTLELGGELLYLPTPPDVEEDPEAMALNEERREELFRALERVRAEHRAALVLRHMEGLSYAEIAEILDVPDGTAKGWVNRGRAALLVALSEEERGGENSETEV